MNPLELVQGSAEWMEYRIGKITGSRVKDVMDFTAKGEPGTKRKAYMMELLCERLTGLQASHFPTEAMRWGVEQERFAVAAYELTVDEDVRAVGISQHPTMPFFCSSPDRFVGKFGLYECKNPTTAKHVQWMLDGKVPDEHLWQLVSEIACEPHRDWVDFHSHDSRLPLRHQDFYARYLRNAEQVTAVETAVQKFEDELQALMASLDERNPPIAEPAVPRAEVEHPEEFLTDEDIRRYI